jgi:P-type Ca2+ transporter type 2C
MKHSNRNETGMNPDSREPALPWHSHAANTALETFSVDAAEGLSDTEVERRRRQYGPNELTDRGVKSPWVILLEQFKETMVIVLIVAAAISGVLGEVKDAIAILVIVILNAVLGFTQEYKAEQAMAALKRWRLRWSRCGGVATSARSNRRNSFRGYRATGSG